MSPVLWWRMDVPSRSASVPTFMPQCSWWTSNSRSLNKFLFLLPLPGGRCCASGAFPLEDILTHYVSHHGLPFSSSSSFGCLMPMAKLAPTVGMRGTVNGVPLTTVA